MLSRAYRRLSSADISELFRNPEREYSDRYVRIHLAPSASPFPRFAVITPSKSFRLAVQRSKLRRVVYSLVKAHFSQWTEGVRVAILLKRPFTDLTSDQRSDLFVRALARLRLAP